MADVTFDTGVASLTLPTNRYPDVPGESYPMPSQVTSGGRILSTDLGSGEWWESPPVSFVRLTDVEIVALGDYIKDDLVFKTTSFTFNDAYGNDHLNMYYESGYEGRARVKEGWSVVIKIRKDMSL